MLPVSTLRGVGPRSAAKLAAFGIETVQDVLFHLPRRYEDRTRIVPIGGLRPGDHAVIEAQPAAAGQRWQWFAAVAILLFQQSSTAGFITRYAAADVRGSAPGTGDTGNGSP